MERHGFIDDRLADIDMFRSLSTRQLRTVTSLTTRVNRPAGTLITREGRRGAEFVILLEGEVQVSAGERLVATRGPGDFLGEISILGRCPQTATAMASSPLEAAVIARPDFWTLLHEAPAAADLLRATMAERIAEMVVAPLR